MHTKTDLMNQLEQMGIRRDGTLLMHSSMKAIGEVDGGADTVLDALSEYMKDGLLVIPTHTWRTINRDNPRYHVLESETCIGVLTEMFRKRPGVIRSLHPTHSVAALGKDAESFIAGDERWDTPCARGSVWGKLLDRKAQIILVGVDLRRNTFIHGIEEWVDIPGRMTDSHEPLVSVTADGTEIAVPSRRHCGDNWSEYFWKVDDTLAAQGAMSYAKFGDAETRICDAERTYEVISHMLRMNPDLFSDNEPLDRDYF